MNPKRNQEQDRRRGGTGRQVGRQATSYFEAFKAIFYLSKKRNSKKSGINPKTSGFVPPSLPQSPFSSLQAGTRVSWGKDSSEGNISPPFAQILFLTLSEMKLRMSTVGSTLKNTMHKLFLDLKSLMQNFTRNWKVTLMKLTPVDLNI